MLSPDEAAKYYFVHSYMAPLEVWSSVFTFFKAKDLKIQGANIPEYVLATTDYGI